MEDEDKWRVKVYRFGETAEWKDLGTGNVSMHFVERLQSLTITVHSEDDCEYSLPLFSPVQSVYC